MLHLIGGILMRVPASGLGDLQLLDALFFLSAFARVFPVEARILYGPIQVAFRILQDIGRKLIVRELEEKTLNHVFRIGFLVEEPSGCRQHERVVPNEEFIVPPLAVIQLLPVCSRFHFASWSTTVFTPMFVASPENFFIQGNCPCTPPVCELWEMAKPGV